MNQRIQPIFHLLQFIQEKGFDPKSLCQSSGLDWEKLKSGEQEPDLPGFDQLWQNAVKLTGDDYLGLHLGEHYNLSALGIVGQLIQNSPTIEVALQHACQFLNLISSAFQMTLEKSGDYFSLVFNPDQKCLIQFPMAVLQSIDTALVFSVKEYQGLTLGNIQPVTLHLAKPNPQSFQEYHRIFKCPIRFNAERFELKFDAKYLNQNIVMADYQLLNLLVDHAQLLLSQLPSMPSYTQLVKRCLIDQSNGTFPSVHDIAKRLNISARTLQRYLKEEGSHFQAIRDEVRENFARHFLQNQVPIKEIASMLGYNGVSAFSRSFKRWTGESPGAFQEE